MRGRLIFPFSAEIKQLDQVATAADPDMGGPLTSGYDSVFREPRLLAPGVGQPERGVSTTKYKTAIKIPCQVEPGPEGELEKLQAGQTINDRIILVFHFKDLERLSLVDLATGDALIRQNDKLVAIYKTNGTLVQTLPDPPGAYVTNVQATGYGFGNARNLLMVTFNPREPGAR